MDDEPSRAYLVHERLFGPYAFILFAEIFLLAGLFLTLPPKSLADSGVDPAEPRRRRFLALTWLFLGVAAIGHYFLQWPTHWRGDFLIVTPVWMTISLGLVVWWRAAPRTAPTAAD